MKLEIYLKNHKKNYNIQDKSRALYRTSHLVYVIMLYESRWENLIGDKIKRLRLDKEMSLSELAGQANVAKSYLSSIERNLQVNPSLQFLEKVGAVLGVTVNELINENESIPEELDQDWIQIVKEAMNSGISKQQFKEYLEFNKWKNEQREKMSI